MKKKFANHYIDRKYKYHYNRGESKYELYKLDNGWLYSDTKTGIYNTKITKEDLPKSYMCYWDGIRYNFLRTDGVVDIFYQPVLENHILKDDSLHISYNGKIKVLDKKECSTTWYEFDINSYDEIIWGIDIIRFLLMAKEYSGYDIEPIKEQIWQKMLWLKDNEPEMFSRYVKSRKNFDSWFDKDSEFDE